MCDEELTIDGLCNLIVALDAAAGVSACCNAVRPVTVLPVAVSIKLNPLPTPSSSIRVAEKGGPTVTPDTVSIKNSLVGSAFVYPSILTI